MIVLALIGELAAACAGIVHEESALAESTAAEVLFEATPTETAVSYAVSYDGDASTFGWVIPVPGEVLTVKDGDVALFDALRADSQPLVEEIRESSSASGGCGCAGGDKGGGDLFDSGAPVPGGVTVVSEGFTGTYEYMVVQATDATALQTWFDDHGWGAVAAEDLDHYVALGASFVALTVAPETPTTPEGGRLLPPVRIAYDGELRFPAVMARNATVADQRTTVYVLGGGRAEMSGWTAEPTEALRGALGDDPTAIWLDALAAAGAEKAYVLTHASSWEGSYLTRFDTLAPVSVHDSDPVLTVGSSTANHATTIVLEGGGGGGAALLVLPLLGLFRRRRA